MSGIVGPVPGAPFAAGAQAADRRGRHGEASVSDLMPKYYEQARLGAVYTATQVATGSTIVAANVSPVAAGAAALFCLFNATTTLAAVIIRAVVSTVSGTPGGPFVWTTSAAPHGITASANITPLGNAGFAAGSAMGVISQSALTNSALAKVFRPLGGPAAVAVGVGPYHVAEETAGDIIVLPGTALIIAAAATGTNHVVCCGLTWAEVPV